MQYQSPAWFDAMYNNRAMVPDFPVYFDQWLAQSQKARQELHSLLDVSYGSGPQETLDIFPSKNPNAPVVVFIHGGYWRSLDKSDHSFIAPSFVEAGACVVVPNYALCPDVTIPQIVMQMVKALAWAVDKLVTCVACKEAIWPVSKVCTSAVDKACNWVLDKLFNTVAESCCNCEVVKASTWAVVKART